MVTNRREKQAAHSYANAYGISYTAALSIIRAFKRERVSMTDYSGMSKEEIQAEMDKVNKESEDTQKAAEELKNSPNVEIIDDGAK